MLFALALPQSLDNNFTDTPSAKEVGDPAHAAMGETPSKIFDGVGVDSFFDDVYGELKTMARRELRSSAAHTLNTTALVHELYMKMSFGKDLEFPESAMFFSYAGRAMRHILLDRAQRRVRVKFGGSEVHVDLDDPSVNSAAMSPQLALQLDSSLRALEQHDVRCGRVVELHYFAGLNLDQVAKILGVTRRTIDRDWRYARAFLSAQLE